MSSISLTPTQQTILAHADIVGVAALAQLVNVIGPIRAEPGQPAWRQTTFFPFAAAARTAGHTVHRTAPRNPGGTEQPVNVTVTSHAEDGVIHVLLSNTSQTETAEVTVDLAGLAPAAVRSASLLWDADAHATNSAGDPTRVAPAPLAAHLDDGRLCTSLPAISWADIVLTTAQA